MNQNENMYGMTEQVIATDFLISAKSGITNIAKAIAECSTPRGENDLNPIFERCYSYP